MMIKLIVQESSFLLRRRPQSGVMSLMNVLMSKSRVKVTTVFCIYKHE